MIGDNRLETVGVNGAPPVELLTREVRREFLNASWFYGRNDEAFNARFCLWPGQSPDGRKHADRLGREVFPWEGAADTRVRTVDMVVNDEVRLIKSSFGRARLQAIPSPDPARMGYARKVGAMLKQTMGVDMLPFLRREIGIAANWRQMYGLAIMNVWWEQERRLEMMDLTRDMFHAMISGPMEDLNNASNPRSNAPGWTSLDTADLLSDRLKEDVAIAWVRDISPLLDVRGARKVVKDLREVGTSQVPNAYVLTNRPRWTALRPFVDVFFPTSTGDLQQARWIAHREMVSETELKDRVRTWGLDKDFVAEAIKHKGQMLVEATWQERTLLERSAGYGLNSLLDDTRDLVELMHVFYRTMSSDGTPTVMRTILNVAVSDQAGWHGVHTYAHGKYPYVAMVREDVDRPILSSRGLGELLAADQNDIKVQVDSRSDQTSMVTLPPTITPSQRGLIIPSLRPGMRLQLRSADDLRAWQPPQNNLNSIETERSARDRVDTYCGRMRADGGVIQPVAQLYAQSLVDDVLGELTQCGYQTFALGMQYWDADHMMRVANLEKPQSNDEIRKLTDVVQLVFDVRDLNDEAVEKKWNMWTQFVQANDRFGIVDGPEALAIIAQSLDPWMSAATMKSPTDATDAELKDEDQALISIAAGIEPDVATKGWNYPLRLQHIQQRVMENPNNRARYVADPIYRGMIDNRMKQMQFHIDQQQNAVIGRQGAAPTLEKVNRQNAPLQQLAAGAGR